MATATEMNRCRAVSLTTLLGLVASVLVIALTLAMLWTDRPLVVYPTLMIAFVVLFPLHDHKVISALSDALLPNVPIAVVYALAVIACTVGLHLLYHVNFLERPGARVGATVALALFAAAIIACTLLKYLYSTDSAREVRRCDLLLKAVDDIRAAPSVPVL